jgi:Rha family phage regulatory protein
MKELVFIEKGQAVTDSLTVSEVFGKRHDNVISDIENQIYKLEEAGEVDFSLLNFKESTYKNERGREYKKINLTEDAFTLIAMSYTTPEAMKFKVKFIQEFKRMRNELANKNLPSYSIEDPIERAKKWILEQTEKKMLEQRLAETEPKATYYDEILKSINTVNISQIAKDYGLSGQALNSILHDEGVQYKLSGQWLLYSKHQDKGYTKSETQEYIRSNGEIGTKLHTKWTQKGRLFIHQVLGKRGIVPVMDRESEAS